jgi:hypothetical protein
MRQKVMHESFDVNANIDDVAQTAEASPLLSSQFDDTVKLLMNEMSEPESAAAMRQMADHHVLAALLIQGAYPVLH